MDIDDKFGNSRQQAADSTSSSDDLPFWQWLTLSSDDLSRREIIRWWERRRISYNVLVGCAGAFSWISVVTIGSMAVKPGTDFEEPIGLILIPPFYAVLANICYTGGWVLDTILYRRTVRTWLLKAGLAFSLILTSLPGTWAILAWITTLITGKKLD